MKKITVIIFAGIVLLGLAVWSPWNRLDFSWQRLLGIEKPEGMAGLTVYSLGGNMEVKIDGELKGEVNLANSPLEIHDVVPGEHKIELIRKGSQDNIYAEYFKNLNFEGNINSILSYELGPTEEYSSGYVFYAVSKGNYDALASLSVVSRPEQAKIFLDGIDVGNAPLRDVKISLNQLHRLRFEKEGFESLEFEILPKEQADRDKLKDYSLAVEARLFKLPINIVEEVSNEK
ncbi:PEGA domain-containing protein [Candidatus Dojkabacteria bacterium]|nr:PEGA domain-containing protein [Candidatus Dojkabacteria bacterium]